MPTPKFTSSSVQQTWINLLVKFRWPVAIGFTILVFTLEYIQHLQTDFINILKPIYLIEIFLLGLLLPFIFLVSIKFINNLFVLQTRSNHEANIASELLQLLSTPMDEDKFNKAMVDFFEAKFPPVKAKIIISPFQSKPTLGIGYDQMATQLLESICNSLPFSCEDLPEDQLPNAITEPENASIPSVHRYCIPLFSENHPVGVIVLDLPPDQAFSTADIIFIKKITRIIVIKSIEMYLSSQVKTINQRHESELHHFSQNLHDTLGQSIGFIRLKMETIRHDFPVRRYPDLSLELDRVQEVAEEAYQQVRGLLAELHPNSAIDLTTALSHQASVYAQRAGFDFSLKEIGQPQQLPPLVKRQLLFIFREALNNIEKHSQACRVELTLDWGVSFCNLSIKDDGVGFTPTVMPLPDHYGLVIMQERARDISARFILDSKPDGGTQISLIIPLSQSIS
jgi:signal transduction histidine kinase